MSDQLLAEQDKYFLEMCLKKEIPEEAARDLLSFTKAFQDGRFVYAMESGLARYDPQLEGFGCLGEPGFVNCVGVFDEWDAQNSENKTYGVDDLLRQYFSHCRTNGWEIR